MGFSNRTQLFSRRKELRPLFYRRAFAFLPAGFFLATGAFLATGFAFTTGFFLAGGAGFLAGGAGFLAGGAGGGGGGFFLYVLSNIGCQMIPSWEVSIRHPSRSGTAMS